LETAVEPFPYTTAGGLLKQPDKQESALVTCHSYRLCNIRRMFAYALTIFTNPTAIRVTSKHLPIGRSATILAPVLGTARAQPEPDDPVGYSVWFNRRPPAQWPFASGALWRGDHRE